ncbi:hypothetical protein GGI07_004016 [Coemansia sp. Benny D115]|nr:hypothetical protein GGI07_004016 [Coemansia sp. Benny D115]
MSPSANTRTEVANAAYSPSNFASIYAVLASFGSALNTPSIAEPEDLDTMVRCSGEDTQKLKELALALLGAATDRKPKTPPTEEQWPKICSSLASGSAVHILKGLQVPEDVADSLGAFVVQPPAVRVDVLYWLCEAALMSNTAIKAIVDSEADKLRRPASAAAPKQALIRLEPMAEIAKQRYWMFGAKTRQLYLESLSQKGRGRLELLAQTPEEFASVAQDLKSQRNHAFKDLSTQITEEVIPYLERQLKKRERLERSMQREALALANVHMYETRTRKRQRVNYNEEASSGYDF